MNRTARWTCFGVAAVVSWGLPGMADPAVGQAEMNCSGEADFSASPGVSNSPSSGTVTTGGETGTMDCQGQGTGSWGFTGEYGTKDPDSCTSGGEGTASHSVTLPGGERITDDGDFTYGALQSGVFGGSYEGPRMTAEFEVTPIEGDCVTGPITKAHIVFKNVVIRN